MAIFAPSFLSSSSFLSDLPDLGGVKGKEEVGFGKRGGGGIPKGDPPGGGGGGGPPDVKGLTTGAEGFLYIIYHKLIFI